MPWKEVSEMNQRKEFIQRAIQPRANISELCRQFGISRSVGHKLLKRYREEGKKGIEPKSRRPKGHALQTSAEMVCEIVSLRKQHPTWGGVALRELLLDEHKKSQVPSSRTIDRILKRAGLVADRRKSRGKWFDTDKLIKPEKPNHIWTVDFKGWWRTKDGKVCFPLTIRDGFSRYLTGIHALPGTGYRTTRAAFEQTFEHYGIPEQILSDNGTPFASVLSIQGLTRLSAWWIKLGIRPRRILPGCPFMNGSHERMHRDIKAEIQPQPAGNLKEQQQVLDEWRNTYNTIRPNRPIGLKRPAQVYQPSQSEFLSKIPEYEYPESMSVRRVSPRGFISWHQKTHFISGALAGETIGLLEEDRQRISVWYCELQLGITDRNFSSPLGGNSRSPFSRRHARNK